MYVISHYFSVRIIVKMAECRSSNLLKVKLWCECVFMYIQQKEEKEQNWGENFHFILRMCVCCVTQKPSMWHKLEEKKVCLYVLFNKFLTLFFAYGLLSSLELSTRNIACHPSNTHSRHKYFSSLSSFFLILVLLFVFFS